MNIRYLTLALTLGLGIMEQQATAAVAKNAMVTFAVLDILATQYVTETANVDQLRAIERALALYSGYESERNGTALSDALVDAGLPSKLSTLQASVDEYCSDTTTTETNIATMREYLEEAKTTREKLDSKQKAMRLLAAKKRAITIIGVNAAGGHSGTRDEVSPDGDRVSPAGAPASTAHTAEPVAAPAPAQSEGWMPWALRGFGLFGTGTSN